MPVTTQPEVELLLCCARTAIDEPTAARIRDLCRPGFDWVRFYRLASSQGVTPLVYNSLKKVCQDVVDGGAAEEFKDHYLANLLNSNFLIKRLIQLLTDFEQNGIRVIPVKGPLLAESVYGEPALREFGDLDIFISQDDIDKTRSSLLSLGFQLLFQDTGAYMVVQDNRGIIVDVQWQMRGASFFFPFEFEDLWARMQPMTLDGKQVQGLAPEDTLILVCVHGCKHYWQWLRLVCDTAQTVYAYPDIDWLLVRERAGMLGIRRMLLLGLNLAKDLLETELPAAIIEMIETDASVGRLARQVKKDLFAETQEVKLPKRITYNLMLRERLYEKARYLAQYRHRLFQP